MDHHSRPPVKGAPLVEHHLDLAIDIARKLARKLPSSLPLEDAQQEAVLKLLECQSSYDPARGPFHSYAAVAIRRHLGKVAEREVALRRVRSPRTINLAETPAAEAIQRPLARPGEAGTDEAPDPHDDDPLDHLDPGDNGAAAAALELGADRAPLQRAINSLPETERELVLAVYGIGCEPQTHAAHHAAHADDCTRRTVTNRHARALGELRNTLTPATPRRTEASPPERPPYVPPRRIAVALDRAQWAESQMPRVSGPGKGVLP